MHRPGIIVQGHFGEWLQGRIGPDGPVALVTMACPVMSVRVAGHGLHVTELFSTSQLETFRDALGITSPWPAVACDIPLGAGAGASTACLVAAARGAGFDGSDEALARACLATEGASDPLMFDAADRLLWASRVGTVLYQMSPPPACEVVGGLWGPSQRTDPADTHFPDIGDLVDDWKAATSQGDLAMAAGVASLSAARCTALRGPEDPMPELAASLGALGHARAHTGSARALIFAPGTAPDDAGDRLRAAGLRNVIRFATGGAA
ncbi:propanediol utilization protein [Primorskyibacter aestuariivivens]|uniref:propanediol utilization protein n=1 Tax=Primorskyibacter aestuariivivens TaxID=1888912 RepID=UPI002300A500|nr:propanediol utilization protein [Primorskyibacter aestuariivivens]MDA7428005.1 propanediol utilization protein [Primorskyibacter aestuariivivens]